MNGKPSPKEYSDRTAVKVLLIWTLAIVIGHYALPDIIQAISTILFALAVGLYLIISRAKQLLGL